MKTNFFQVVLSGLLLSGILAGCGGDSSNSNQAPIYANCLNVNDPACNSSLYGNSYGFTPYGNAQNYNAYNNYSWNNYWSYSYPYNKLPNYYGYAPAYSPYVNGISQYNSFNGYAAGQGFCGCPAGYAPVYGSGLGLGCVVSTYALNYFGTIGWLNYQPNNNHFMNIPQASNYSSNWSSSNGCYQNVAQSCVVGLANACGSGLTCSPTGNGSQLGLCAR